MSSLFGGLFGGADCGGKSADSSLFSADNPFAVRRAQAACEARAGKAEAVQKAAAAATAGGFVSEGRRRKAAKEASAEEAPAGPLGGGGLAKKAKDKRARAVSGADALALAGRMDRKAEKFKQRRVPGGEGKAGGGASVAMKKSRAEEADADGEEEENGAKEQEEEEDGEELVHETVLAARASGEAKGGKLGKRDEAGGAGGQGAAAPRARRDPTQNTLFVGNVPLSATRKSLKKLFAKYGAVESVRIRSLPVKVDSSMSRKAAAITGTTNAARSSTNAYVVMGSAEAASAALALNMALFEGKHLRVDAAAPPQTAEEAGAAGPGASYDPARTVFLGNLHFEIENEEVIQMFTDAAAERSELRDAVEAVRVVRDPEKNICKGIGFVLFKTKAAARAALELSGQKIHGRDVRMDRVKTTAPSAKAARGGNAGFKVAGGRVEKRKAPSWQGTQVKKSAAGGEKRLKKAQRATPGSTALSRELGGPSKKGKKRRAGGSADGGIPREKGKRPAVAGKKTKQLAVKAGLAAPKFKSPNKTPGRGSKPPGRKSA